MIGEISDVQAFSRRLLLAGGDSALFPWLGCHFGSRERTGLGISNGANRSAG
jgi:hypothetical protein